MAKPKKRFDWVQRPDGKRERWELKSEIALGIVTKRQAKKYPHLRKRMRWVITKVKEKWEKI